MAWMAGQLFVRDVEVPEQVAKMAVSVGQSGTFLSLPFQEALDLFLARDILPPEEAFDSLGRLRGGAFTARRLATEQIRKTAFASLNTILSEGGTFADFAEAIRSQEITLGIAPSGHGYLRTVFDTNTVSAYSAGRDTQLNKPAVIRAIPYRVYRIVDDLRTREEHRALDGKTWDARETDEWRRFQGPNGYNCRCMCVSREEPPSGGAGLAMTARHPDEAFNTVPGLGVIET